MTASTSISRRGEVFGIVGGSGSGKSGAASHHARPAEAGERLGPHPRAARSPTGGNGNCTSVKRRYGVMFQRGALFSSLTVQQNVELPMREHYPMPAALLAESRRSCGSRMVGLAAEDAAKYPSQLSGGMTKRAALARALALDPAILFLDEPTSGLDPISAAAFDALVLELQQGLSLTVVMITHDLDTIFRVCNRVGVIVDGHDDQRDAG